MVLQTHDSVHNCGGTLHHERSHDGGLGRNVIQGAHRRGVGEPGGDPGAGSVEAQRGASFHLVVDLFLFGDEVARAAGNRLVRPEGGEIGAQ